MTRLAVFSCALLYLFGLFPAETAHAADPRAWLKEEKRLPALVELYQAFHTSPELSFEEEQTAKKLSDELRAIGAEVTEKIGGHGVVGLLKNGKGPTVMVRTDLDALPVTEQTELPYASQVKVKNSEGQEVGVMHACGHDIHITNLIGVARFLAAHRDAWQGTVMFIGQPAEERGAGARAMLDAGLFEKFPRPDFALALHVDSTLPAGKIAYRPGYALANVDSVDIIMRGKGGHGAQPHTTIDPIVQAAHLIVDLQSIVSREISPIEPAVITVGSIHGGTKHNIIGNSCHLQLTVRSYSEKVRQHLLNGIRRKALAAATSADAPEPIIKVSEGTPAMFNNERLVDRIVPVLQKSITEANVALADPSMGGEDFSQYGRAGVPIFMYRLGSIEPKMFEELLSQGQTPPSLHSPRYFPDPALTLETGVVTLSSAVLELMPRTP